MDDDGRLISYERRNDPVRVMALSDGVFAVVITLLVLELHVPDLASEQSLSEAMREIWPSFVALFISFIVVAIAWAEHRDLFALIRRTDPPLVWLNILYLLPLSIIPFGASLLTRYGTDPEALGIYGILLVGSAATRLGIWVYATGRPYLLFKPVDARSRRAGVIIAAVAGLAYAAAIAIARFAPTASIAIYAAGPVLYFTAILLARTSAPPGSEVQGLT